MTATQRRIETPSPAPGQPATASADASPRVPRPATAATGHAAVPSPALALQARVEDALSAPASGADPQVAKWPGWVRLVVLTGAAASSWAAVIAGARILFQG